MKKIDAKLLDIILFILSLWFLNNKLDTVPSYNYQKFMIILSIIFIIFLVVIHDIVKLMVWKKVSYKIFSKSIQDRMSLNPINHIGFINFLVIILTVGRVNSGFSKEIKIDYRNCKNPRLSMFIVNFSGILFYFLVAALFSILSFLANMGNFYEFFIMIFNNLALISINLMFFNMIPIFPLDISYMIVSILPQKIIGEMIKIEKIGTYMILIFVVLKLGDSFLLSESLLLAKFLSLLGNSIR